MDLTKLTGTSAFGRAYYSMMQRDAHAHGGIDRVLASSRFRLCQETADSIYAWFTPLEILQSSRDTINTVRPPNIIVNPRGFHFAPQRTRSWI